MNWTPEDVNAVLDTAFKIVSLVAGVFLTLWSRQSAKTQRTDQIRRSTRGVYNTAAAEVAKTAAGGLEKVAVIVDNVEGEVGRLKIKERMLVKNMIVSMNANPDLPRITQVRDVVKLARVSLGEREEAE